ncbi:hypothetical protein HK097_008081 [Rhizophlyctis rosea]|uniref:Uncharacterized protein n=1 Tax=Rhizophlyctis rosea TaxID=64517 RepID=A0AAD5SCT4_9FUNG|nr:hypothetical protein HK097_008081 [Rhizophlyctis rosea]
MPAIDVSNTNVTFFKNGDQEGDEDDAVSDNEEVTVSGEKKDVESNDDVQIIAIKDAPRIIQGKGQED